MWKPKNLLEALLPMYILNVIFCHGVIQYPSVDKSKIFYSFLYSIISTILFLTCFILVFLNYSNPYWTNKYNLTYYANATAVSCAMFINLIVRWVYQNKTLMINSRIIKADETLDNLGVPVNARGEFTFSIKVAIFWMMYSLFVNLGRIIPDDENLDLLSKTIIACTFQHGYQVNLLIDVTFCLLIKHMKIRFESVNKVLSDIFELQTNNLAHKIETDYKWAISRQVKFEKDFTKILNNVKRIHLELGILCHETTKIYGIPIILTMISAFANITSLCVFIYRDIRNPEMPSTEKIVIVSILSIWLMVFTSKLIIINYFCAVTLLEWERTGEIIHKLEIESEDSEFRKEIQQFSVQILQNPLKFSPCGFIDLGFYFIRDFVGSVTSQVILIIQTYPS